MLFVNAVLPIFLLIILGRVLANFNIVTKDVAKSLIQYVFWVAFPAVIFYTLSSYHISEILVWRFWLTYPLLTAIVVFVTLIIFRVIYKESVINSVVASLSAGVKNTLLIGFPVMLSIVGHKAVIPVAITVIVFNCVLSPIMLFMFELNNQINQGQNFYTVFFLTARNTLKNPLIISALFGILFSVFHIPVPYFFNKTLGYLSLSVIPCALFAVGIELSDFQLRGNVGKALFVTIFALFVCPLVAMILCFLFHLSPFYSVSLVILSAMPTAKSMFIYASKYQVFQEEASAIISLTTIFSILSIPIFIYLCHWLWPSVFVHLSHLSY